MFTSSSTGRVERRPSALSAWPQAAFGQDRRMDPVGQLPQVLHGTRQAVGDRASCALSSGSSSATVASAVRTSSASDTSRCCVPSCRSRSIRRRA